jgi:hypothetical protein
MSVFALIVAATSVGALLLGYFLKRPQNAAKELALYDKLTQEGKTYFPITLRQADFKKNPRFDVFEQGNFGSQRSYGFIDSGDALTFTHQWEEGKDKGKRVIQRRIIAVPMDRYFGQHHVQIQREGLGTKLFGRGRDVETDSIAFNKNFHVTSSNKDAAIMALAPRIQNALVEDGLERVDSIGFGSGFMFAVLPHYDGALADAGNIAWLSKLRDTLQSVTGSEFEGDAMLLLPISREEMESRVAEAIASLKHTAHSMPWLAKYPKLPNTLIFAGTAGAFISIIFL